MKTEKLNLPPLKSNIKTGIGYSPLTEKIYLGKQNHKTRMWVGDKKDITQEFMAVLNEFIGEGQVREISTLAKDDTPVKTHLFIQILNNKNGIERAIKFLQKELQKC